MRLLLDTHTLLWWLQDSPRLSRPAYHAIEDPEHTVCVSAASAWEVATKHNLGKLPEARDLADDMIGALHREGFEAVAITVEHAERAGRLPLHHRDPFDRMLIAQGLVDGLTIISNEGLFDRYGVDRLW